MLEPALARLAAQRADHAGLEQLERAVAEQRALGDDRPRAVQAEGRFHRLMWRLADNAALERAMRDVYVELEAVLDMAMRTAADTERSLRVHERTLAALRDGEPGGGRRRDGRAPRADGGDLRPDHRAALPYLIALPRLCRHLGAATDAVAVFGTATTMWRQEPAARRFLIAQAQGALGAGAGYVALLILAYDRIGSAWAATAVLLADLLPAMLLGPLLGALADRTSRLGCAVVADVIRAGAFAGLVLLDGVAPMIGLALLAGLGTALFRPADVRAAGRHRPEDAAAGAQRALRRGARRRTGARPGCGRRVAAARLAGARARAQCRHVPSRPPLLLTRLRGQVRPAAPAPAQEPVSLGSTLAAPSVRALIGTSGAVAFAAATMNVGELVLAQRDLAAGATGYALLVSAYGFGLVAGSLRAGRGGDERRRHLAGSRFWAWAWSPPPSRLCWRRRS